MVAMNSLFGQTKQPRALARIRQEIGSANRLLLLLLAFCLPLSTSVLSVVGLLIALFWLVEGGFRAKLSEIVSNPVSLAVMGYLLLLPVGLLWTDDLSSGLAVIEQHWKLMLMPVFLTIISKERRGWYLVAFIAGMTVAMAMTYLAWFGLLEYSDVNQQHLTKKVFHVVYNPMLAMAIYLLLHEVFWGNLTRGKRMVVLVLAGTMTFDMFITEGRAGQLVFFVLAAVLLVQLFRKNLFKAVLCVVLVLPAVFYTSYRLSPTFQYRVQQVVEEIALYKKDANTSVGLRLLYWQNSLEIIRQAPFLGVGTGDFTDAYAVVNSEKSPGMPATDNPHNQYILILCQFGVLGLLVLLLVFFVQLYQSLDRSDGWHRLRFAFPVFFLTIMFTESYLVVYETGFLFSLLGSVLYKLPMTEQAASGAEQEKRSRPRYWLILSYRANVAGSACSQHIDDRIPLLREKGITPILLTGPVGGRARDTLHFKAWSLAPSGIRFEIRHFLRKHLHKRWQFKCVETVLLLPVLPLYLLEKIIINLESEWSWCFAASLRGAYLQWRFQPEVIYSTGGSASAHVAALIMQGFSAAPWLAETQDPLVHDENWERSRMAFRLYRWLEKKIGQRSTAFIFLTEQAMSNASSRMSGDCRAEVIYPGANADLFTDHCYQCGEYFHFAHFGSLAGSRNLKVLLQALAMLFSEHPKYKGVIKLDMYGSLDSESLKEAQRLNLEYLITHHGLIDRQKALEKMQQADCLLLIQNTTFFSTETIPSKVYEYLMSRRPILGLLYRNTELENMLTKGGHPVVDASDAEAVKTSLYGVLQQWMAPVAVAPQEGRLFTVEGAVLSLITLSGSASSQVVSEHTVRCSSG